MRKLLSSVSRRSFLFSAVAGIFAGRVAARGAEPDNDAAGDVFPLVDCPVCETTLGGDDKIFRQENREFRVCDQECLDDLQANFFSFLDAIDDQITVEQTDDYPLETCVADGKPLEASETVSFVFRNRLFRACCEDCRYKIEEEAAKSFARLNAEVVKKQAATYPSKTCIVSGKPLGKGTVDHVCANLLVRLADADQIARFNERPGKYLDQLRTLRAKQAES